MGGSCRVHDDERGTVLFLTVMLLSILLILAGVGVDLARVWVAREQAQTAVDAAALAGAGAAVRYVTVSVRPGHCETCCSDDGRCRCCCVSDPVTDRTGTEKYMIEQGGWRRSRCDSFLGIRHRWLEYPSDTGRIARQMINLNYPGLLGPGGGGEPVSQTVKVFNREGDRYYPSVMAGIRGNVGTAFLNIAGIDDLPVDNCGQAASFYQVLREGMVYGRNGAPADACRENQGL